METQTPIDTDWRKEMSVTLHPKLKFEDGETKTLTFLDEGRNFKHPDYKPSIIFSVKVEGSPDEKNTWFINKEAYGTLNQLIGIGKLTGAKVTVNRKGSKKSDTRYTIRKVI